MAVKLADHSITIALAGRTEAKLGRVLKVIHAAGGQAAIFPCNVSQADEVEKLSAAVVNQLGQPQILINSAGLHGESVPIGEATPGKWIETFSVNAIGPCLTC